MNKTTIILSLLAVVIIGAGGWMYMNYIKYAPTTYITETKTSSNTTNTPVGTIPNASASGETETATVTTTDTKTGATTPGAPNYTFLQVATHKDATSCYSVINNIVYDLTMWVNVHPGGKNPILSLCGNDGTKAFMNMHHGGEKFMSTLARFKIGLLTQ